MATRRLRKSQSTELSKVEQTDPREFRKTNEAIGLRVREGKLSLLTRKVFNVMMFHAQELKTPGVNAPIDTPSAKKYFWIPLSDLARDARYDSNDVEYLKQQLEELQNIKLLMENERQWTSERLVSSITLVNPHGLKKHSGQVWFGFAFPPEVHELVMSPGIYTRFSIFYQGLLRSGPALALYEICRRYATNPSKLTLIESYAHWYGVLTGNPVEVAALGPYKYFKRDVIKPAISEINALTDIQVELIEHKNGRRIERLQFKVQQSKQTQLAFPAPPVIDVALMERVMALGLSKEVTADLLAEHGDDKIRASLAMVEARMAHTNSPKLDAPAGYFRWSLKEGADVAQALQLAKEEKKKSAGRKALGPTLMEKFLSARALDAYDVYKELNDSERVLLIDQFKADPSSAGTKITRGIEGPMVKALFSQWYAKLLWGEPTAVALASFVEKFGVDRN